MAFLKKTAQQPPRVLIGFKNVEGFGPLLKQGFEHLKIPCSWLLLTPTSTPMAEEEAEAQVFQPFWARLFLGLQQAEQNSPSFLKFLMRPLYVGLQIGCMAGLYFWALVQHDVFILIANTSFLEPFCNQIPLLDSWRLSRADVRLLKRLGKTVMVLYADRSSSLPVYLDGTVLPHGEGDLNTLPLAAQVLQQKQQIVQLENLADVMIDRATQGHFHQRPFVSLEAVGIPYPLAASDEPVTGQTLNGALMANGPKPYATLEPTLLNTANPLTSLATKTLSSIRILHVPLQKQVYGSNRIHLAIEALKQAGLLINYISMENFPRDLVLKEMRGCDLLIDELYTQPFLSARAQDAAFLGKPTLACGYNEQTHAGKASFNTDGLPLFYCHPTELENTLRELIAHPLRLQQKGAEAQQFLHEKCHPSKIAAHFLALAYGDIPPEWKIDPLLLEELDCYGMDLLTLRHHLKAFVQRHGLESLCLQEKPLLEKTLMRFLAASGETLKLTQKTL